LKEIRDASGRLPDKPLLYLHGAQDGCLGADLARAALPLLKPPSEGAIVEGTGHFLHLERPDEVNARILRFVA
jgi:pimeloyl-ACP methyl ester carboxylesterase